MIQIWFGNIAPRHATSVEGEVVTYVEIPDNNTEAEVWETITHPDGVWNAHSSQPPTWVACDDPSLAEALSTHYVCPIKSVADVI